MHPNGMPARTGRVVAHSDRSLASLQDATLFLPIPVVSLALNQRLIAAMPPASNSSLSVICGSMRVR
jgi:hypothetical protein